MQIRNAALGFCCAEAAPAALSSLPPPVAPVPAPADDGENLVCAATESG